ncbi:MAG TPA: MBL fold metallo-hydrolase [Spirochaetota bacterium]|nr:MBL fold metallo-hydrolase [Spirochaetota bacterium]
MGIMKSTASGMAGQHFVLTPLGGGREIGGNAWHIEWDDLSFLIDCGTHPERPAWLGLPALDRIARLDFVILTHAHSDHSGALPALLRSHPVPVWMTDATSSLMGPMMQDALKLQRRFFDIDRFGRSARPELGPPLFESGDVERVFELQKSLDGGFSHKGLTVTPFCSGHILGGVGLVLEKNSKRVLVTSDISDIPKETSRALFLPQGNFDLVISEGTRGLDCGDTDLPLREDEEEQAIRILSRVLSRKGSVLFPAFVIERAQSVARLVMRARDSGRIPPGVPLYMAGLADSMTALHAQALGLRLDWKPVPSRDWFDDLLSREQAILVAGSGMLNSGSGAARLAEQLLSDRKREHGIIFTGYLTPQSPGGRLMHRERSPLSGHTHACINQRIVDVRTNEIHQVHLSCHASGDSLVDLVRGMEPAGVILVHGDPDALATLSAAMRLAGLTDIRVPENGESISFSGNPAATLIPPLDPSAEPMTVVERNPWNGRALRALAGENAILPDGESARNRLQSITNLLLERAMRDGNLGRAKSILDESGSFIPGDDREAITLRIDEIAAWCPQNDDRTPNQRRD